MDPTLTIVAPKVEMINAGGGMHFWTFGLLLALKALGNETGGSYSLFDGRVPPGVSLAAHIHTREDESWYVLDGELEWYVGDKTFQATKGSFIHLPRNVPHGFTNKSDKETHLLLTCAPAGFEMWFVESGTPVADEDNPGEPPEVTPEIVNHAVNLAKEKYGLTFVGSKENL